MDVGFLVVPELLIHLTVFVAVREIGVVVRVSMPRRPVLEHVINSPVVVVTDMPMIMIVLDSRVIVRASPALTFRPLDRQSWLPIVVTEVGIG